MKLIGLSIFNSAQFWIQIGCEHGLYKWEEFSLLLKNRLDRPIEKKEDHLNLTIIFKIDSTIIFFSFFLENLFPVLDILRMAVCDPNVCGKLMTTDILNLIIQNISVPPANQLMSIRILLNMLSNGFGRGLIETCLTNIFIAMNATKKGSSNLQTAISTLLLNLTIVQANYADQTQCQLIVESIINFLLWNNDAESLYRAYRAIGNLLCTDHAPTISAQLISTDQIMDGLRSNMSAQQQNGFEKINEISQEIVNAL